MRVSLRIEFLTGSVHAADGANRVEPEWPPHPMRLFAALVAAHFQHDGGPDERQLLELLESLPAPTLTFGDACTRNTGVTYVPVNDDDKAMMFAQQKGSQKKGTAEIAFHPPIGRGWRLNRFRSGRSFPVVTPFEPVIYFHWHDAHLHEQRATLQRLAERVPYLGRSSSVVRLSVVDDAPPATLQPCPALQRHEFTSAVSRRPATAATVLRAGDGEHRRLAGASAADGDASLRAVRVATAVARQCLR